MFMNNIHSAIRVVDWEFAYIAPGAHGPQGPPHGARAHRPYGVPMEPHGDPMGLYWGHMGPHWGAWGPMGPVDPKTLIFLWFFNVWSQKP